METAPLPVRVLKDFTLTVDGVTYSGKKGETMELPFWIGRALEEVEFVGLKATDVKKILLEEEGQNLATLPSNFYEAASVSDKNDRGLRKVFMQLMDKRVEKVAKAAAYGSIDKNAVHEERVLFSRLASAIQEWKRRMRKDMLGEQDEV